jgi:hypothetical protein
MSRKRFVVVKRLTKLSTASLNPSRNTHTASNWTFHATKHTTAKCISLRARHVNRVSMRSFSAAVWLLNALGKYLQGSTGDALESSMGAFVSLVTVLKL